MSEMGQHLISGGCQVRAVAVLVGSSLKTAFRFSSSTATRGKLCLVKPSTFVMGGMSGWEVVVEAGDAQKVVHGHVRVEPEE